MTLGTSVPPAQSRSAPRLYRVYGASGIAQFGLTHPDRVSNVVRRGDTVLAFAAYPTGTPVRVADLIRVRNSSTSAGCWRNKTSIESWKRHPRQRRSADDSTVPGVFTSPAHVNHAQSEAELSAISSSVRKGAQQGSSQFASQQPDSNLIIHSVHVAGPERNELRLLFTLLFTLPRIRSVRNFAGRFPFCPGRGATWRIPLGSPTI